jgi:PAS domain S-box-containing protein
MTDTTTGQPASVSLAAAELLDALGQAVNAPDTAGLIVYWNAAAESLYGWSADEVLGRDIADVTVPHMSRAVGAQIMEALRNGVPWSGGFPVQRRDGATFQALVTDAGVYRDGELVGVVGESMNLGSAVRPLLERSSDAAIMLTPEGLVTYASPAVTRLFGWQPDDLVGGRLTDLVHPEDRDLLEELLHATDGTRPERAVEVRVRSDHTWTWVEAATSDLLAEADVRGYVCNLRRSERLAQLDERERLIHAMHVDVLQDLFSATLQLDHLLLRAAAGQRPQIESAIDSVNRAIQVLRDAGRPPPT